MTTVVLVSVARFYAEALQHVLPTRGIAVAAMVTTAAEALRLPRLHTADAVVVELHDEAEVAEVAELTRAAPAVKVVVVGVDERKALACLEAGAAGYVEQGCSLEQLVARLQSAVREELVCSGRMAYELARRVRALAHAAAEERVVTAVLTAREREVIALVAAGLTDKEIALRLVISPRTAKNHVHSILKKLNVPNRMQAAAVVRAAAGGVRPQLDLVPELREVESVAL